MKSECSIALKEWAIICDALGEGEQIAILRKGGIREDGGIFRIQEKEFLLFPTYEHQNAGLLRTPWKDRVSLSQPEPDHISISFYAEVARISEVMDEAPLRKLYDHFIWNDNYLKIRFDFNPYDPLFLIILRVFRLSEEVKIPMRKEYSGCKSWVTLSDSVSLTGAIPCLSEEVFHEKERDVFVEFEK